MKKSRMNLHNAREKEQLARMRLLKKKNICFFCKDNYLKLKASPAIYDSEHWYIKRNDYPYKGSVNHYLIVSKKHINKMEEISQASWSDFLDSIKWLTKKLKLKGYSIFVRSGSIFYTGATIDHLHFHLISGVKKTGPQKLEDYIMAPLGHKKK